MSVKLLAEKVSLVTPEDYYVLKTMYILSKEYEVIPYEILITKTGLKKSELDISLSKLHNLKLIYKHNNTNIKGYRMNFSGLDVLAVKSLYAKGIIKSLGIEIGKGKESNVYYGYDNDNNIIIIKFHRIGKSSFKNVKRVREVSGNWLIISVQNAINEYRGLECVSENRGYVPKPYGHSYNAVVMEYIDGKELYRSKVENAEELLFSILSTIRIAYVYCNKMVHGDLSAYNILIGKDDNLPYVIDWPQWKSNDEYLLIRDLKNILGYFNKHYKIMKDLSEVLKYIKGEG
jgi:RIO kinase 2